MKTITQYQFYTGKGGVGKTSLACANAVKLADAGNSVLLISTDPASNLSDVLGTDVIDRITPHKDISSLHTMNIDPETAAIEYRSRSTSSLHGILPEAEVQKITEGLSGACTTEIASFDEFSRFITGEGNDQNYDYVIFDTAPTGHTLRLLELPAAWDDFLDKNPGGASCIGPSSALKTSKERYKKVIASLRDPSLSTFFLVTRPQKASLREASRTSDELNALGLDNQKLLINGRYKCSDDSDELGKKIEQLASMELLNMPENLKNLSKKEYPLLSYNVLGIEKLRSIFNPSLQLNITSKELSQLTLSNSINENLEDLILALTENKSSGLIMTMGKGGVGKTIVAATIATLIAERGHQVLLTTTDPAAHVNDFMNQLDHLPSTLTIERIDPKTETKKYTDKIFEQKSKNLNDEAKKLLAEDLKSPCNEEVAIFNAFSKAINKAKRQFVVIDTAPTGHTLLLLDTTGKYHQEILKTTTLNPEHITTPYMSLQKSELAKIILVTLPETTPMHEAKSLQDDLVRAGIKPFCWVINQCLSALPEISDPLLRKRASNEIPVIESIKESLSPLTFILPYLPEEKLLPAMISLTGVLKK